MTWESNADRRNRAPRPYIGRGADSYAAKLLAQLAHPSYRDADPEPVTRCEPMSCSDCGRTLAPEDGTRCWPCECEHVKRTNLARLTRSTPTKKRRR